MRPKSRSLLAGGLMAALVGLAPNSPPASASLSALTPLTWMRIDQTHPQVIYAGGYRRVLPNCQPRYVYTTACPSWAVRSLDGGKTWRILNAALAAGLDTDYQKRASSPQQPIGCFSTPQPFLVHPDGRHLYTSLIYACGDGVVGGMFGSSDQGMTWRSLGIPFHSYNLKIPCCAAISPVSPQRVFAAMQVKLRFFGPVNDSYVLTSDDSGAHWRTSPVGLYTAPPFRSVPTYNLVLVGLVADPVLLDTVYAGLVANDLRRYPMTWIRSDDAGRTWAGVWVPDRRSTLDHMMLQTDVSFPGLVEARPNATLPGAPAAATRTRGIPADVRYISADHGRTWRMTHCPGDLHGLCPTAVVFNIFGTGESFGFFPDGLHAFNGSGPSGPRLALKLPTATVLDAEGGTHFGDPVYVLGHGVSPQSNNAVYKSPDGGRTWRQLVMPPVPLQS
jgi:hypothetical protein